MIDNNMVCTGAGTRAEEGEIKVQCDQGIVFQTRSDWTAWSRI